MQEPDIDDIKSKTQIKKEMLELQDLGVQLTKVSDSLLGKCELPTQLSDAIEEFKRLKSNGARKRQLQFIGKLMRSVDTEKISLILNSSQKNVELEKRKFHQLELLREALISGDTEALNKLILEHPALDIQHLRQLIRQSQKELKQKKEPLASRKLFRYLRETVLEE